jgi:diguanylate cyclase
MRGMNALLEALEASSVAVWDYDVPSGRVSLTAEWSQMLGYSRAVVKTTPEALVELVPAEERGPVAAALRETLAGKRDGYRVEHRVKGRERTIWIRSAGRVMERDASGRALRVVGTNADITRVKEAEALLQLIVDAAPALICYIDQDLRFRFHNKAYEDLLGLSGDQIDGRHARDVIGEEAFAQTEAYARRALAGEVVDFERAQTTVTGGKVDLQARFMPHLTAGGKVDGFVGVLVDISERKAAEAKIAALALMDPLTGLPNRRTLDDRLAQACALATRRKKSIALLFIDLDGFKPVNDRFGHDAGDAVLVEVAKRLSAAVRQSDTVARTGGDEFVVMLIDAEPRVAIEAKAASLIEAVSRPITLATGKVAVGASIGVALCPEHGKSPNELTRNADAAMYAAKRSGRGTCRFFEP